MSTISSSIFADSDILPVGRWLSNRRRKHYRQATNRYSAQLCEILEQETKGKLTEINTRSIDIKIEGKLTPLSGITLDRNILPNARVGERLSLINLANDQLLSTGFILSVSPTNVKIKLLKIVKSKEIPVVEKEPEQNGNETQSDETTPTQTPTPATTPTPTATPSASPSPPAVTFEDLECRIKFDQRGIFDRHDCVAYALQKFQKLSCSMPIHQCLLGIYDDCSDTLQDKVRVMPFASLPQLKDKFQRLAVEQSMRRRISLVEGPAGSGKTLVAAYTACNMCRLMKRKILLCSPIQANVIRMARMIEQIDEIRVVELPDPYIKQTKTSTTSASATSKRSSLNGINVSNGNGTISNNNNYMDEKYNTSDGGTQVSECNLDKLIDEEIYLMAWRRSENVFGGLTDSIHDHASRVVSSGSKWLRLKHGRKILQKAEIVCCNLVQTGPNGPLEGINFDMLIIDDAQVASEIDCIVPIMTRGVGQVTLLSDLRRDIRLPRRSSSRLDKISSTNSLKSNKQSVGRRRNSTMNVDDNQLDMDIEPTNEPGGLFKRWLSMGISAVALRYQYRAHETLSNFTNHQFYRRPPRDDPKTNAKLTAKIRDLIKDEQYWNWLPNNKCLTAIFDCNTSTTVIGKQLERIIDNLLGHEDIHRDEIGIVANRKADTFEGPRGIFTGTVDDWVGQERNFIILAGLSRSMANTDLDEMDGGHAAITNNPIFDGKQVDFLFDDDVLNVALTRARLGLFIVADLTRATQLSHHEEDIIESENKAIGNMKQQQNGVGHCKSWQELVHYYQHNNLVTKFE